MSLLTAVDSFSHNSTRWENSDTFLVGYNPVAVDFKVHSSSIPYYFSLKILFAIVIYLYHES
jgi:hypothetical protein